MNTAQPLPCPGSSGRLALQARWVFPVGTAPIENATLILEDGLISEIVPRRIGGHDLGNVAIIPGLVNAHTHLEFSDLTRPLEAPVPFTNWLLDVIAQRRSATGNPQAALAAGWREAASAGTTLVADIASPSWNSAAFTGVGPRVIPFFESLGLRSAQTATQAEMIRARLVEPGTCISIPQRGISPHAPYSVHPDLCLELVNLAVEFQAPLAMHLAETREEIELLNQGSGPFVPFLERLGVWEPGAIPPEAEVLDYLCVLAEAPRVLVVHGNYLKSAELDFLRNVPHFSVIYCPRTHAYFGHSPHPWRELLARDINLAIGTDSRASNPDLSVWSELKFLCSRFPEVSPAEILKLGTLNGARALGLQDETGSLEAGKRADVAVVSLGTGVGDPYEALFAKESGPVATMVGGGWMMAQFQPPVSVIADT